MENKILTPHLGEFANLIGIKTEELKKDLLKYGKIFTKRTGVYLVLKSAPTIIFNPAGEAFINTTGNPSLAKFGTGDVLTGMIGGLLSQQKDIEAAIISAVYLHSLTADILVHKCLYYMMIVKIILFEFPILRKSGQNILNILNWRQKLGVWPILSASIADTHWPHGPTHDQTQHQHGPWSLVFLND